MSHAFLKNNDNYYKLENSFSESSFFSEDFCCNVLGRPIKFHKINKKAVIDSKRLNKKKVLFDKTREVAIYRLSEDIKITPIPIPPLENKIREGATQNSNNFSELYKTEKELPYSKKSLDLQNTFRKSNQQTFVNPPVDLFQISKHRFSQNSPNPPYKNVVTQSTEPPKQFKDFSLDIQKKDSKNSKLSLKGVSNSQKYNIHNKNSPTQLHTSSKVDSFGSTLQKEQSNQGTQTVVLKHSGDSCKLSFQSLEREPSNNQVSSNTRSLKNKNTDLLEKIRSKIQESQQSKYWSLDSADPQQNTNPFGSVTSSENISNIKNIGSKTSQKESQISANVNLHSLDNQRKYSPPTPSFEDLPKIYSSDFTQEIYQRNLNNNSPTTQKSISIDKHKDRNSKHTTDLNNISTDSVGRQQKQNQLSQTYNDTQKRKESVGIDKSTDTEKWSGIQASKATEISASFELLPPQESPFQSNQFDIENRLSQTESKIKLIDKNTETGKYSNQSLIVAELEGEASIRHQDIAYRNSTKLLGSNYPSDDLIQNQQSLENSKRLSSDTNNKRRSSVGNSIFEPDTAFTEHIMHRNQQESRIMDKRHSYKNYNETDIERYQREELHFRPCYCVNQDSQVSHPSIMKPDYSVVKVSKGTAPSVPTKERPKYVDKTFQTSNDNVYKPRMESPSNTTDIAIANNKAVNTDSSKVPTSKSSSTPIELCYSGDHNSNNYRKSYRKKQSPREQSRSVDRYPLEDVICYPKSLHSKQCHCSDRCLCRNLSPETSCMCDGTFRNHEAHHHEYEDSQRDYQQRRKANSISKKVNCVPCVGQCRTCLHEENHFRTNRHNQQRPSPPPPPLYDFSSSDYDDDDDVELVVDQGEDSDGYSTDNNPIKYKGFPYQNEEEYEELVQELEESLQTRNRNRVQKALTEFEQKSKYNEPLEKPIIDYEQPSESEEPIMRKISELTEKRKQLHKSFPCKGRACCNCQINQNGDNKNYFPPSKNKTHPPQSGNPPQFGNPHRSKDPHWQMNKKTGEWHKIPYQVSKHRLTNLPGPLKDEHICGCTCTCGR